MSALCNSISNNDEWMTVKQDHFRIKWAENDWEIEQARRLRRQVFCDEQGLFEDHDIDVIDRDAQVLVAIQQVAGMSEQVVGTVRIYQSQPGVWWGGRLAVEPQARRQIVLGSGLIKLAVRSASALGCQQFNALVQPQNEKFFQRLNWLSVGNQQVQGVEHVWMQAQLACYPALDDPAQGFWVEGRRQKSPLHLPYIEGPYFERHYGESVSQHYRGTTLWN